MPTFIDLTGRRFTRWTVLERSPNTSRTSWLCRCDCGTERVVNGAHLPNGASKSCGCLHREIVSKRLITHGATKRDKPTREYRAWAAAKTRCHNPRQKGYNRYGGRGIIMCDEWKLSFETFLKDMGICPPGMTLDRRDNNGPYCKDNCRWATRSQQSRNKSSNINLTLDGKTMCAIDWAKELGLNRKTITQRLEKGWSHEKALTTPLLKSPKRKNQPCGHRENN